MPNFSVPLSGLDACSAALSTCANNLANLNTVGYKDQQIQFADLFYQNLGSDGAGDPIQQGAGVQISSQPSDFTQGNVTSTGIETDVAINGNGFFVVQNSSGVENYTRAGNFEVGTNNLLETADGQNVLGYQSVDGVINTTKGLGTLALGAGTSSPATPTANLSMTSNLDATAAIGSGYSTQATIYDSLGAAHQVTFTYTNADVAAQAAVPAQAATGTLTMTAIPADTQTVTVGSQTYTFTTTDPPTVANSVLIGSTIAGTTANLVNAINDNTADAAGDGAGGYDVAAANLAATAADAGGGVINFTASATGTAGDFAATSAGAGSTNLTWNSGAGANGANLVPAVAGVTNTWTYAVTLPAADVSGATGPVSLGTGTLVFNGDGTLQSISPTGGTTTATNPTITVPPTAMSGTQPVFADGANPLTFTWKLFNPAGGGGLLTQLAAPNSTASIQQDGTASGTLQSFSIGSDGTITGSFSNGTTATLGQIALASFADEQGLSRNGDNTYSPTLASGQPTVGAPTSGGLGSISGGALEQSNVDIATEFANLIVAQRSYEANARVVTTFDQIAQDTIALKQ